MPHYQKIITRPVVLYGFKTSVISREEQWLKGFKEGKILGPKGDGMI
jgi:hypothetical protein